MTDDHPLDKFLSDPDSLFDFVKEMSATYPKPSQDTIDVYEGLKAGTVNLVFAGDGTGKSKLNEVDTKDDDNDG